ncbi:hypothetical protein [Massilia sp. H6]|uniref:hypothetical protein n=1 Tax=Massilia sp. H6 TaxID=2970464 RepID=UPI002169F694|nr:hypothetical protein [Massilia sp. H6]UVW29242.1 hypothetical protein NRS07_03585 [Massilia sp. H6]
MKPTNILITALLTCALMPAAALADDMGKLAEAPALDGPGALAGVGGGPLVHMHRGRPVKNAPYSAEMVSERIQTLGDGNQIVNKTSTMFYRDSAGRTRTEIRNDEGEVRSVSIVDPVGATRYLLRPREKTAIKLAAPRARARIDQLREQGQLPGAESEPNQEPAIVKQVERSGERHGQQREVRIRIAQAASPAMAARLAPMIAGVMDERKWASKADTRDLGTREFYGVKATGTSRSYEIPAGEIGNRQAIAVSSETWVSPELQAVVFHKRSDPRTGEAVFRLERLSRAEPAAALFAVPADYTVKDPVAVARRHSDRKAP